MTRPIYIIISEAGSSLFGIGSTRTVAMHHGSPSAHESMNITTMILTGVPTSHRAANRTVTGKVGRGVAFPNLSNKRGAPQFLTNRTPYEDQL